MASALHDTRDRNVLIDLLGAVLGIAVGLLLVSGVFAGTGLLLLRWASALSS